MRGEESAGAGVGGARFVFFMRQVVFFVLCAKVAFFCCYAPVTRTF